jgi:Fe-S oxidoreductase
LQKNESKLYMVNRLFAPGCALMIYKPELAGRLYSVLNKNLGKVEMLMTCCQHDPGLKKATQIINICPGCDKRFRNDYLNSSTISLWEILAESDFFPFPDYHDCSMTIIDACPTREQEQIHSAIRKILSKMNINLIEPEHTKTKSTCCGDSFYGVIPVEKVMEQMVKKSSEMPVDDVVVYCVSCTKAMFVGGKKPRYLVDLLFAEETQPKTFEPDEWHKELSSYIEEH